MADLIFEDPRLVSIYDAFDGQRLDLENYLSLARELRVNSILDIGCGTGCLASLLAKEGYKVTGVDPAKASLDYAQKKPNSEKVNWILGDATNLPSLDVDLAVMTGNVAQVFLDDRSWAKALSGIRLALNKKGRFIFEVRDPTQKAWLQWNRERTLKRINLVDIGYVESWCELTGIQDELVSFRWTFLFESDGVTLVSDSTLRFRDRRSIMDSLTQAGFIVNEIRDAPDRPGKEFVFITSLC